MPPIDVHPRVPEPHAVAIAVPRERAPLRGLGIAGLVLALPVVLVTTLWPTHFLLRLKPRVVSTIEWFHARGMLEWLWWTRLEVLTNIAMMVPLTLLLALALSARRWWWLAAAAGTALSIAVETAQLFMPGRVASTGDIVANAVGALLGALLALAIEAARRRMRVCVAVRQASSRTG